MGYKAIYLILTELNIIFTTNQKQSSFVKHYLDLYGEDRQLIINVDSITINYMQDGIEILYYTDEDTLPIRFLYNGKYFVHLLR